MQSSQGTNQMALSVLQMAHRRGCVCRGLGVIGSTIWPNRPIFWPALSTINHSLYELGCRAWQETVEQIESVRRDEKTGPQNFCFPRTDRP